MKDDNTPSINVRHRKKTSHIRLRTETAKILQKLSTEAKMKHAKSKKLPPVVENSMKVPSAKNSKSRDSNSIQTPRTKKDVIAEPTKPSSKFRKRQLNKSWLPTHLYHAKRAHITPPSEPLWRFAIPLTPTDKSYRRTHRAMAARGCVAWDTSYMSTISLEGIEANLINLLRGLGVDEVTLVGKNSSKWRRGTRWWEGWIIERDGYRRPMAPVHIFWCLRDKKHAVNAKDIESSKTKEKRKMFLRVHPSAFLQIWNEILKIAKIQHPPVMIEDLRFELGSIEITGPGSTEALVGVLNPTIADSAALSQDTASEKVWPSLGAVTNPGSLPANALLGFEISDPRLRYPPQRIPKPESLDTNSTLLQILTVWLPDEISKPFSIFDRDSRYLASKSLSSQKSINRRKSAALPGMYPDTLPRDPKVPILLMASRALSTGSQGSWSVILPWKWVLPVWYSLMHYPLSSGSNPRFGCLQEKRQTTFEQGVPWFPGDFPGTSAGWIWELQERGKRKADWEKRPKGKRIEWESVDLGNGEIGEIGRGWACDWERLFQGPPLISDQTNTKASSATSIKPTSESLQTPLPTELDSPPLKIHNIPSPTTAQILPSPTALSTISLSLLSRGAPTACARIYRLPTTNAVLRAKWLALVNPPRNRTARRNPGLPPSLSKDTPPHVRTQQLAASLLTMPQGTINEKQQQHPQDQHIPPHQAPQAGDPGYPSVPKEEDLIGFVTTGNFNLGEGKASAIGCIAVARVIGGGGDSPKTDKDNVHVEGQVCKGLDVRRLCMVRNVGQRVARLAKWEFV